MKVDIEKLAGTFGLERPVGDCSRTRFEHRNVIEACASKGPNRHCDKIVTPI